jgi:hypothetical protein
MKRIKRFDVEGYDFNQFHESLSYSFNCLNKLVKEGISILQQLADVYRSNKLSNDELIVELTKISNELLEKDVQIARHQEDNSISRYLLGLFQSFKASNIGNLSDQIIENNRIYGHMLSSIGVLKLITFKTCIGLEENMRVSSSADLNTKKDAQPGKLLSV